MQTAVLPGATHPAQAVDPQRAITRIRALQAQQWPLLILANQLGYTAEIPFLHSGDVITVSTDRRVHVLYQRIGDRKGPCPASADEARRLGYWPAIHYDDDMTLIPSSIPGSGPSHDPDRFRRWLRIMAFTARGLDMPDIAYHLDCVNSDGLQKQVGRVREQVGLRLNQNIACGESRVMPGQDALLREIKRHTGDLYIWDCTEWCDTPGLDYKALWMSLCDVADLLHGAGEAGTPAHRWPTPKNHSQLAATLTTVAA